MGSYKLHGLFCARSRNTGDDTAGPACGGGHSHCRRSAHNRCRRDDRLLIVTGTSTVYRTLGLDAEYTDRTVELTTPTESVPAESLERVDAQLLCVIDDAAARLADDGYTPSERIHMTGVSAAQFSVRFAFPYPDGYPTVHLRRDGWQATP